MANTSNKKKVYEYSRLPLQDGVPFSGATKQLDR